MHPDSRASVICMKRQMKELGEGCKSLGDTQKLMNH